MEEDAEEFFLGLHELMDIVQYDWFIDDADDYNFFRIRSGRYSGKEFSAVLGELSLMSFARIMRYPAGMPEERIDEYEDFVKSNCDFLILFYDGGYYEIYAKEESMIIKIMKFCVAKGFEKPEYADDSGSGRSWMHY